MTQVREESLADRILQLERSLGAYRQLHTEELDELERRLMELKGEMLAWQRERTMMTETDWQG